MGPVDDERAFAGPVDDAQASEYLAAEAAWREREQVVTLCPGGPLIRNDLPGQTFLAPALFRTGSLEAMPLRASLADPPQQLLSSGLPLAGPLLVVHRCEDPATAEQLLEELTPSGRGRLRFGSRPRNLILRPEDRQIHGALLVERLPPGLPEPRP